MKRRIRVALDGSELDPDEEDVVGTCDKGCTSLASRAAILIPESAATMSSHGASQMMKTFFSAGDGSVELGVLPGSNCPRVKDFMRVTKTWVGRRQLMMQKRLATRRSGSFRCRHRQNVHLIDYQVYSDVLAEMDEYSTGDLREDFFCEFKKSRRGKPCATYGYMHTLAAVQVD